MSARPQAPTAHTARRPAEPTADRTRWLHVGDPVTAIIGGIARHSTVTHIELVEPGQTYGEPVQAAPWALVPYGVIVADLADGHFAYGEQLRHPD